MFGVCGTCFPKHGVSGLRSELIWEARDAIFMWEATTGTSISRVF